MRDSVEGFNGSAATSFPLCLEGLHPGNNKFKAVNDGNCSQENIDVLGSYWQHDCCPPADSHGVVFGGNGSMKRLDAFVPKRAQQTGCLRVKGVGRQVGCGAQVVNEL